jgi:hypothetical protein
MECGHDEQATYISSQFYFAPCPFHIRDRRLESERATAEIEQEDPRRLMKGPTSG